MGRISRILGTFAWTVEHVLWGNEFLRRLGEVWYQFWISTPVDANNSLCLFCKKEERKEEVR